jgi:hypothetical protein
VTGKLAATPAVKLVMSKRFMQHKVSRDQLSGDIQNDANILIVAAENNQNKVI